MASRLECISNRRREQVPPLPHRAAQHPINTML